MIQEQLTNLLLELVNASKSIKDDSDYYAITHKYNMILLGENFNTIYSDELAFYLRDSLNISTTVDEVNTIIPYVCQTLKMKYEKMVYANDLKKLKCYQITLWE